MRHYACVCTYVWVCMGAYGYIVGWERYTEEAWFTYRNNAGLDYIVYGYISSSALLKPLPTCETVGTLSGSHTLDYTGWALLLLDVVLAGLLAIQRNVYVCGFHARKLHANVQYTQCTLYNIVYLFIHPCTRGVEQYTSHLHTQLHTPTILRGYEHVNMLPIHTLHSRKLF